MSTKTLLTLDTAAGKVEIPVDVTVAPQITSFVRGLVEAGHFDGAAFYRSTTLGEPGRQPLIQGGPLAPLFTGADAPAPQIAMHDMVESTGETGRQHRRGTVSLARDLITTGRILPELFICLDDYPELDEGGRSEPDDRGFPAFGSVSAGLDVVEAIAAQECEGPSPVGLLEGQILTEPVAIISATFRAAAATNIS